MKRAAALFLAILILASGLTLPTDAATVTVRGEATIFNGDLPAAREEALIAAKRNAVEQVLGVKIKAETAVQDFMLADDTILSMTEGYVKNSKILSEKQERDYLVLEVECEVVEQLSPETAAELMRNFSAVVGITTDINGSVRNDDDRLSNRLVAELVKAGYDVRDAAQLLALDGFQGQLLAAAKHQDVRAARWIGQQLLSNVVIVGHARLEEKERKTVSGFAG
ncbi:flagellar assembly protein T N-terminal domain-containing protein, partial [bacterium]|nr:flagellar assembly protein T N-terminal domain-containing protein [bacterium]